MYLLDLLCIVRSVRTLVFINKNIVFRQWIEISRNSSKNSLTLT